MKKIKFLLFSLIFLAFLGSCEEDKVVYDNINGKAIANFVTDGGLFTADLSTEELDVYYIDVEVSTISTSNRAITIETIYPAVNPASSTMFNIDSQSLVIPAGSYNGRIKITANESDPLFTTSKKYVKIKLTGLEGGYITSNKFIFDLALNK